VGRRCEDEQSRRQARTTLMIELHRGGLRCEDEQPGRQARTTLMIELHRGEATP
jgi:hypothetical protein